MDRNLNLVTEMRPKKDPNLNLVTENEAKDGAEVAEDDRVPFQLDSHEQNRERGRCQTCNKRH